MVSAQDQQTLDVVAEVYGSVDNRRIHRAPTIKVAEAAKVIENTQRDLNIAFMNELSLIFQALNIDTADVLSAARTKWNFPPFQPGLVGGHCIGVDPYYLTYRAAEGRLPSRRSFSQAGGSMMAWGSGWRESASGAAAAQDASGIVTVLGLTFS